MKLVPVEPEKIPDLQLHRRGRVSYPIIKQFMESKSPASMIDRTGIQQSMQGLYSCLNTYVRNHDMPIKCFSRDGELYLVRLDVKDDGSFDPDWKPGVALQDAKDIDEVTDEQFKEEKDAVTK